MRFTSAALTLLTLIVPALCAPTGLITVEKANGPTSGKYIVTLKKGVNKADLISQAMTFNVTHKWDIINGFAGHCDNSTLDYLRAHSDVKSIAEDSIVTTNKIVTQTNAPWGLERISKPTPIGPSANPSSLNYTYTFDDSAGAGVDIYVIDTGIYIEHVSFQGRARWGATFGPYPDIDRDGHGTHCAGTAASYDYGVAKAANLIAVKVLEFCSGTVSDVISGMDWVQGQAASSGRPSVASMSIGAPASTALDNAVASLTSRGVHVVVAAGNDGTDASDTSPARAPSALTVGASDITDTFASFSNYGAPVKVIAPGANVTSAWIGNPTANLSISGTSMATPHVSGLVAYLIRFHGNLSPAEMISKVQSLAVKNILKDIPAGTVNLLVQNTY